jgi:hypothetical protein
MAGPLGNIMTVNPGPVMPQLQPQRPYVGTPFIDAGYREMQEQRAQQDQTMQVEKNNFDVNKANAGIANQQAFGSGLAGIVADPTLTDPQRQQQIGTLAANTGQPDVTLRMRDAEYARKTKMEAAVMELAGNGQIAAAKHLAQQNGIEIPDQVLQDGILSKGFALGAKLYDYDPRQAGAFAMEFKRTNGDYNAALQKAGEPVRKPQYAPSFTQVPGADGQIYTMDQHTGTLKPTGVQGQGAANAYVPYNYTDDKGQQRAGRFNTRTGVIEPIDGVSSMTKAGGAGGAGGRPLLFEVRQREWLKLHPGDQQGALEFASGKKGMDPAKAREIGLRVAGQRKSITGVSIYKTDAELQDAANRYAAFLMGDTSVNVDDIVENPTSATPANPPVATTPGAAPTVQIPSYDTGGAIPTFGGVPSAEPPLPPGFELD